ncbi:outer membrane beta-barrel protein [Avibacterium sp. 21-599]|uniref:outer membrane beta-barrel protein n=1 Tax=Avibacterium sp. 21-599 TaxID=2911528 RepID=UPI00224638FF|nr:outer membrane beta-barrel protein [Avibacterium sp. 21-599]MCW9718735.1 porin family protein [Avibacterium sp. 21-599]
MRTTKKLLLTASSLLLLSWQAEAASINAILSWEDVRYNDDYNSDGYNTGVARNYHGYRLDTTISPDNSNWSFTFGIRQNRSKGYNKIVDDTNPLYKNDNPKPQISQLIGQRDYQRLDFGVGYCYRFNKGWVQPSFNVRQDKTININGNNDTADFYNMDLTYNYNIADRWVLNGRFKPEVIKYEYKRNKLSSNNSKDQQIHQRATRFGYEIEQGLRYLVTPNLNFEIAYNDIRNRRDDNAQWENSSLTESNPQLRLYMTYKTNFGLTISPYFRKSIFGKIKVKSEFADTVEKRDQTRYAFRMNYQINNNFMILSEFYRENTKFLNTDKQTSKQNYLRLGMRVTF